MIWTYQCNQLCLMHWAVVQLEDDTAANALPPYTQSWFWRLVLPAAFTVACLVLGILYATIAPNEARTLTCS